MDFPLRVIVALVVIGAFAGVGRVGCCRSSAGQEADELTAHGRDRWNRSHYGAADRVGLLRLARVLGLGRDHFPFTQRGA